MQSALVKLTDPENVEMTFSLSMKTREWRDLMRQMPSDGSPAGQLGLMISAMLGECIGKIELRHRTSGYTTVSEGPREGGEAVRANQKEAKSPGIPT